MKKIILIVLIFFLWFPSQGQTKMITVKGRVTSFLNKDPLVGVNVVQKGTTQGAITDENGKFSIEVDETATLVFSYIGYETEEVFVNGQKELNITLSEGLEILQEIGVYATGYQDIPKERATGSFVKIDNGLLNRRVGTNILNRLEDVTSGVIFNRTGPAGDPISIRGRNTIFANAKPLIVIDNFPYDGDLTNINPNDVESMTVLKDAAAASIWGARAGNGVIVITTKKGTKQRPKVSFNSNLTVGSKPDPFYQPQMSVADYIQTERTLFDKGFYAFDEISVLHPPISPVVELLIAKRDGQITAEQADAQIATLMKQDVRNDYKKYFYRPSVNQQYSISINGGSEQQRYFLSTGYDKNIATLKGNDFSRFTLNAGNTFTLLKDKLDLSTGLYYTESNATTNGVDPTTLRMSPNYGLYPYARLVDDQGNPLTITKDYRTSFVDDAEKNGLLDWHYRPVEEIGMTKNIAKQNDLRLNAGLKYKITKQLQADILYQHWNNISEGTIRYPKESYFTRNLINNYTEEVTPGELTHHIPIGDILDGSNSKAFSDNLRAQLNYSNNWNTRHSLNAIGGYEIKNVQSKNNTYRYYGYDDDLSMSQPVDYVTQFPLYYAWFFSGRIPDVSSQAALTDRFKSYYGNAAYTLDSKYTLSVSARKDESNLFGVRTNQKGVPLWSAGGSWIISDEKFYPLHWLSYLKLRGTYGSNGNVNKSVTAFTTARINGTSPLTGLPYARIANPPNPDLRWEQVKVVNIRFDFETQSGVIGGSIEYYNKRGIDLIGGTPYAPSTGVSTFYGNTASTKGNGFDIVLNSKNIDGAFNWNTQLLFSTIKEKVTDYKIKAAVSSYLHDGDGSTNVTPLPLEGKPLFSLYSYDWAGLDPQTGDPRGYLEGVASNDYAAIINGATPKSIRYHGSARPTTFGSLRNTLTWKGLSLSFNITYRLGYYFRRSSIIYGRTRGLGGHSDYALRWQQPGDESHTNVPSIPQTTDNFRDDLYRYSSVLVEKGDHIRFQDINLSYTLDKNKLAKLPVERAQLYMYVNNIGILWKATKTVPDPDYRTAAPQRTFSVGLKVDF